MNTKNTWVWFVVAAMLAACIFVFQHYFRPPANVAATILPGMQSQAVTSVQIFPNDAPEIRADRANNSWQLSKPISYPAQSAAIETFLGSLQKLAPSKISAAELRQHPNSETEFGFENPQFSIAIESGDRKWQLKVGNLTAPGDQVYLRVVGLDGAFLADADWLKLIPRSATDWRSTALVDTAQNDFDSIILTNGAKVIELHRDATNHLWRMTRPLIARANNEFITAALQQLQSARVTQFATDDANADMAAFGLQPAALDLWLGSGTNFSALLFGKNPTNDAAQIYAKREGLNAIVATSGKNPLPWFGSVNDFRDPYLLELTSPVAEIEMRGENNFTLQRQGTNGWRVAGEKFPVDAANVQQLLKTLAGLRVADFVQDVVSAADLESHGLTPKPSRQIVLRSSIDDSNAVIAQLDFAVQTNGIFVHRTDEDLGTAITPIYSIAPEDLQRLPDAPWEFRDRQIWNFTPNDVAQITICQNGRTNVMVRTAPGKWSLVAGSGIIVGKSIEDTATALGNLSAFAWVGRNVTAPAEYGFNTNNLQVIFELKNGEKHSVDFGAELPKWNTSLAAVTLDGERWQFLFPPGLYQFVLSYLTIPAQQGGIP